MFDFTERSCRLLGTAAMEKLEHAHAAVFGLGGVGGACVEALVRGGVGELTLIDFDRVSLSNLNRQLIADRNNLGRLKTDAAAELVRSINPDCRVHALTLFWGRETADSVDFSAFDYVIDAIDNVTGKLLIIEKAQAAGVPVISSMGTGNKLDPSRFRIADIYRTSVCPLAKVMRCESRRRGLKGYPVLYSEELPTVPAEGAGGQADTDEKAARTVGSLSFVPPVAGMMIAGEVIRALIKD